MPVNRAMATNSTTENLAPSSQVCAATDQAEANDPGDKGPVEAPPAAGDDAREPIQSNFRVLARTNAVLRSSPADSGSACPKQ